MFVRTERLLLRPAWKEDAGAIAALARAETKIQDLFGREGSCDLLSPCALESCSHAGPYPRLLVMKRTEGEPELIGVVGLAASGPGEAELLCWIARGERRKGYGREAGEALLRMARHSLRLKSLKVPASCGAAAQIMVERLGFAQGRIALRPALRVVPDQAQAA